MKGLSKCPIWGFWGVGNGNLLSKVTQPGLHNRGYFYPKLCSPAFWACPFCAECKSQACCRPTDTFKKPSSGQGQLRMSKSTPFWPKIEKFLSIFGLPACLVSCIAVLKVTGKISEMWNFSFLVIWVLLTYQCSGQHACGKQWTLNFNSSGIFRGFLSQVAKILSKVMQPGPFFPL